jgi:hypothetical protein
MKPHVQNAQGSSGADGHACQQKVDAAIDWRSQFQKSPTVFLAAALGGGLLIGIASNDRKSRSPPRRMGDLDASPNRKSFGWDWNDSIGVVKSVLIGIAITQAKKVLFNQTANPRTTPAEAAEDPAPSSGPAKVAPDSAMH